MDPRFQSIHLGSSSRRDDFRRARAALYKTCGDQTLAGGNFPISPSNPVLPLSRDAVVPGAHEDRSSFEDRTFHESIEFASDPRHRGADSQPSSGIGPSRSRHTRKADASDLAQSQNSPQVCFLQSRDLVVCLKVGLNSIGRLPDNDVVIPDGSVSRRHCTIVVHSDLTCELHDTASKNGTAVNGRKLIGPIRLRSGDEITLCDQRLRFLITTGDQPPPWHDGDPDATQVDQ